MCHFCNGVSFLERWHGNCSDDHVLVDVTSATLSCGFNGFLASNTTPFYPVCKSLLCPSSAIFDNDTLGVACAVTGANGHTTERDAEVTLTCVFDPELQSMLLEGSFYSCKLSPCDIKHPYAFFHSDS